MKKNKAFIILSLCFLVCGYLSGQEINLRYQKAEKYFDEGQYSLADSICREWLPLIIKDSGIKDSVYQLFLELSGRCQLESGNPETALKIFEELKSLAVKDSVRKPERFAGILLNLGICEQNMGNYGPALHFLQQALTIRQLALGIDHPDYASSLSQLASLYTETGKYDSAFLLFENARNIQIKLTGREQLDYASTLDNMAILYYSKGDYKSGIPLLEEALSIRKEILGVKHPSYAESLNNLAAFQFQIGNYSAALPLYVESTAIDKEVLGEKNPDYAIDLNNLASLYMKTGDYASALPLLLEASAIYREVNGNRNPHYISSLINLASLYEDLGNYKQSKSLYLEIKQIQETTFGKNNVEYVSTINNLAFLLNRMGDYEKAIPLYREAKNIRKELLGPKHPEYARSLNNLAYSLARLGNYNEAVTLYKEAIIINKEKLGTAHPDYAASLSNLAIFYDQTGDSEASIPLLQEVCRIDRNALGPGHPDYAKDLINLADHYSELQNDTSATSLLQEALSIYKRSKGPDHPDYALALMYLAKAYKKQGNLDIALPLYQESAEIFKKSLGTGTLEYIRSQRNLAICYMDMGNYDLALPLLEDATQACSKILGDKHPDYAYDLRKLAELNLALGRPEKALLLLEATNSIIDENIQNFFAFLTAEEKIKYLAKLGNFYDFYLSFLTEQIGIFPELGRSGYDNELLLKGLVLSSATSLQKAILDSRDSILKETYEQMRLLKRQMSSLLQTPLSERPLDLEKLKQQADDLETELTRRSQVFGEMQLSYKIKWKDVQLHLPEDEAAIEFVNYSFSGSRTRSDSILYCAFILKSGDSLPRFVSLCSETELRKVIPTLGASSGNINRLYSDTGIYDLIWRPVVPLLKGVKCINFALSGLLNTVSMTAVICPDHIRLIDKYRMNQLSSTRILATPGKQKPIRNAVVYGGIYYDIDTALFLAKAEQYHQSDNGLNTSFRSQNAAGRSGFKFLPGTLKEAQQVTWKLKQKGIKTALLTGPDALEESFNTLSGTLAPSIIHLSTHGFYHPDTTFRKKNSESSSLAIASIFQSSHDPLFRSGLLMTGANLAWKGKKLPMGIEDGILTAKEVSNMNLLNTQLVVLSACHTGRGDVEGSEGVLGLQRGFKMAGVRFLIMSLWEVPDKETSEFMARFYDLWLGGLDIRNAFRNTQLYMKDKYFNEPSKWAAFVLVE